MAVREYILEFYTTLFLPLCCPFLFPYFSLLFSSPPLLFRFLTFLFLLCTLLIHQLHISNTFAITSSPSSTYQSIFTDRTVPVAVILESAAHVMVNSISSDSPGARMFLVIGIERGGIGKARHGKVR